MPDPKKLLYYRIGVEDLVQALQANNDNRGAGYIERNGQQHMILLVETTDAVDFNHPFDLGQLRLDDLVLDFP